MQAANIKERIWKHQKADAPWALTERRGREKEKASSNSITVQEQAPHNDHLNPLSDLTAIRCILSKRTGYSVGFFRAVFINLLCSACPLANS